jgi:Arc/MetJ-type ribon-helix-helix transcriptional regulator
MEVRLTPDQEAFVRQAIESGRFQRPEDAVEEALSLWEERERKREEFVASFQDAKASLARGEGREITPKSMHSLASEVKQRGKARLGALVLMLALIVQLGPAQTANSEPGQKFTAALGAEQIDVYRAFLSQYQCTEAPGCEQHSRKYLMLVTLAQMPEVPIEARCLEPWPKGNAVCTALHLNPLRNPWQLMPYPLRR